MSYVFAPSAQVAVPVKGSAQQFPVHRIYCVARNYAAHAREMGMDEREAPFFFMKPADALVPNGEPVPYPSRTANFHHEVELVIAIGKGGSRIEVGKALEHVFGYAVGNDLTRRDLQFEMRDKGRPWDISKGFDHSAPITAIHPVSLVGHAAKGRIWLEVNGEIRQQGDLADLIWSVPEIIAELSTFYTLAPGDLIYTGTPAGVNALQAGDRIRCGIEGFDTLINAIR